MNQAPSFVRPVDNQVNSGQLDHLNNLCKKARMMNADIKKLEELLSKAKAEYNTMVCETLPDFMDTIGITKLTFTDPSSNQQVEVQTKPYYHASIEAAWDEDRRQKAFNYLEQIGEGDLIKTTLTIPFPRDQHEAAKALAIELAKRGIASEVKDNVHHMTLTAWLKNQVEERQFVPDLTTIGGVVGRKITIKDQ